MLYYIFFKHKYAQCDQSVLHSAMCTIHTTPFRHGNSLHMGVVYVLFVKGIDYYGVFNQLLNTT
jgi:fido (protein-threonine AMPylation protein)